MNTVEITRSYQGIISDEENTGCVHRMVGSRERLLMNEQSRKRKYLFAF